MLPRSLPIDGCLVILYPTGFIPMETVCKNDLEGGSKINVKDFYCDVYTNNNSIIVYGFWGFNLTSSTVPEPASITIRM